MFQESRQAAYDHYATSLDPQVCIFRSHLFFEHQLIKTVEASLFKRGFIQLWWLWCLLQTKIHSAVSRWGWESSAAREESFSVVLVVVLGMCYWCAANDVYENSFNGVVVGAVVQVQLVTSIQEVNGRSCAPAREPPHHYSRQGGGEDSPSCFRSGLELRYRKHEEMVCCET